jgi:hypothetical protein
MEKMEMFFGGGKHLSDEGVALYVDALKLNTLEQLPPIILDHVGDCHECKKNITGLFALLDDVDYSDVRSHPLFRLAHRSGSRVPLLMKIAAVVAGVASLATLTYYVGPFRQGQTSSQTSGGELRLSVDSVQKGQDTGSKFQMATKEEFAANFKVDPELENLVNRQTRSEALSVMSPTNGSVLGPGAVFRWKGEGRKPLTLGIMNNKGDTVLTENGPHSQFVLKRRLSAGLYYWRIESESELLYVGKFFVK